MPNTLPKSCGISDVFRGRQLGHAPFGLICSRTFPLRRYIVARVTRLAPLIPPLVPLCEIVDLAIRRANNLTAETV